MRKHLYIGISLLFLLSWRAYAGPALPDGIIELDAGPATDFSISDYDGKTYTLAQSRGKWVLVHFWASWCGPCRREMPKIAGLIQDTAGQPLDIVLVNTAEDEDTIFSFLGGVAPALHSYMDRDGLLTQKWAPRGLPTTFFIDPQGRRRYLALGGRPWDLPAYREFIESLLKAK